MRGIALLLIAICFISCKNEREDFNLQKRIEKENGKESQKSLNQILFAEPQIIDSSGIVIYPLILEKESDGGGFESSSYRDRITYWNLVFYNSLTNSKYLLVNNQKIVIYSFEIEEIASSSGGFSQSGINIDERNIFYNVVSTDINQNKYLDADDPTYLFVSDKFGRNFRQLSPDNFHVVSWETLPHSSKVILQTQQDNNKDKKFGEEDLVIPMVVDLKSGKRASPTFNKAFIDTLENNLSSNWRLEAKKE